MQQHHGPPAQRVLHRKAGVAQRLHRQGGTVQLQNGGDAAGPCPAKAEQHRPQQGRYSPAAQQQPPRRKGKVHAEVRALHAGQHRRPAQQQVQQQIPRTQPDKAAQAGHTVGGGHNGTAG